MNIKRQYSLPNCRLLLEGIAEDEVVADGDNTRPLMSMVFHVECSFAGREQHLSGGITLLENLTRAVSAYAQEFLSGVRHPVAPTPDSESVQLVRSENRDLHHLRCYPKATDGEAGAPFQIDLTTVQLFDLVEAIDQFFADTRTLPQLTLQLAPASRRYRQADVPIAQRSAPLVVGASGLAIAALALFLVPVPGPIEAPERRIEETASQEEEAADPADGATDSDSPTETPDDEPDEADGPALSATELDAALAEAEIILDPTELDFIQRYTRRQLEGAWQDRDAVSQDLTYRVSIGRDGAIVAYEPVEATPVGAADQTPLPDLIFQPTQAAPPEAVAEYKIVFTNNGVLQMNPWAGYQGTPTLGPEIDDPETLATLSETLEDQLSDRWEADPDLLSDELVYRVGVTESGAIADYEPQDAATFELDAETPLPDLLEPEAAGIGDETVVPQEPLGQFTVVLRRDGSVEVAPF